MPIEDISSTKKSLFSRCPSRQVGFLSGIIPSKVSFPFLINFFFLTTKTYLFRDYVRRLSRSSFFYLRQNICKNTFIASFVFPIRFYDIVFHQFIFLFIMNHTILLILTSGELRYQRDEWDRQKNIYLLVWKNIATSGIDFGSCTFIRKWIIDFRWYFCLKQGNKRCLSSLWYASQFNTSALIYVYIIYVYIGKYIRKYMLSQACYYTR